MQVLVFQSTHMTPKLQLGDQGYTVNHLLFYRHLEKDDGGVELEDIPEEGVFQPGDVVEVIVKGLIAIIPAYYFCTN